jgi:hypothetical protein
MHGSSYLEACNADYAREQRLNCTLTLQETTGAALLLIRHGESGLALKCCSNHTHHEAVRLRLCTVEHLRRHYFWLNASTQATRSSTQGGKRGTEVHVTKQI